MARMAKRNVERVSSSRKSAGERPKSIAALQLVRRCALGCIARIGALVQSAHWCRVRIGATHWCIVCTDLPPPAVAAQAVVQQVRQLGVAVGHVHRGNGLVWQTRALALARGGGGG